MISQFQKVLIFSLWIFSFNSFSSDAISTFEMQNGTSPVSIVKLFGTLSNHCVLFEDGSIKCWYEENSWNKFTIPNNLGEVSEAFQQNGEHMCLLLKSGEIKCLLTDNDTNEFGKITTPAGLTNIKSVGTGIFFTCANSDIGVSCWGVTEKNGSGDGGSWEHQTDVPKDLVNPQELVVGNDYGCVISENKVRCWGSDRPESKDKLDIKNPKKLYAGSLSMCASNDLELKCWGYNYYGETDVPANLGVPDDVVIGWGHTCALKSGVVNCWGNNDKGQIDVPNDLGKVTQISVTQHNTCALSETKGVVCWGIQQEN